MGQFWANELGYTKCCLDELSVYKQVGSNYQINKQNDTKDQYATSQGQTKAARPPLLLLGVLFVIQGFELSQHIRTRAFDCSCCRDVGLTCWTYLR